MVTPLLTKLSHCSEDVKVNLFKTYCCSFYGSNLWVKYVTESLRKIKSAYNRIFRNVMIINDPKESKNVMVLSNVDISDIIHVFRNMIYSFRTQVYESNNCLVNHDLYLTISLFI